MKWFDPAEKWRLAKELRKVKQQLQATHVAYVVRMYVKIARSASIYWYICNSLVYKCSKMVVCIFVG